ATIMAHGCTSEEGVVYGPTPKSEILGEIQLIDNMLTVMKSKSLLNTKRGQRKMLDGLLALAVGDGSVTPGGANNHLLN
ncbi:MAG: hypothetical protein LAT81_09920, partial [Oceanicaulis sp.]|nr:hypothetical protein [Oceanicaulis sp.]